MPRLEASCRAVHARRDRKSRFGKCEARSVWSVAGDMIDVMVERSDAALLRRSSRGGFHLAPSGSRAGSTLHELQYAMNTRAVDDHHAFEAFVAVGMWPVTGMTMKGRHQSSKLTDQRCRYTCRLQEAIRQPSG